MKKLMIRIFVCFIPYAKTRRLLRQKLLDLLVYVPEKLRKYKKIKALWNSKNSGEKLLPGRFDEYDLVFAIGAACPMTWELIMHKLRTFSNPFDWTAGMPPSNWMTEPDVWRDTRFITKIKALCNDFSNFFNRNDIKMVCHDGAEQYHFVCNIRTKVRFIHLFPMDKSIESVWDDTAIKVKRRGDRLIKEINSSHRVLICWAHRIMEQQDWLDDVVSDDDIKRAVKMLRKKFPKTDIDLVLFEHDGTKRDFEYNKIEVCKGAYRIQSNHYIVTDDYKVVCNKVLFENGEITRSESLVVAEALDNIKLSNKIKC